MGKLKKAISAFASAAVAASAFIGVAATVRAEAVITYSDGKVSTTESGVVIVASYDSEGRMTSARTYGVEANDETLVAAAEGDRIMFWESKTNANPLTAPITVGAATEAPTAEPTPTPTPTVEPTETPVPERVYIDESFDSYTEGTVIASASGEGNSAPEAVTYGNITYKAGYRKDGIADKISFTSGGALSVLGTRFGSSGRGVLFTFETADIPAVSELADGQVLAMSFDMATSSKFTVTGYGEIAEGALGSTSPVEVSLVLDKSANKQYMQVTDGDGNILVSNEATLTATTFSGMDFCNNSGTSTANAGFTIDNIKVEAKAKDSATASFTVKDSSGAAVSGAKITIDGYTLTTGEDGTASALIPYGDHTATASKEGLSADSATVTVGASGGTASFVLSDNDQIPNELIIGGGQSFIAAPKTADTNSTEAFTVTVNDDNGAVIAPSKYALEWAVYPAGTTTPDDNVTISEDGIVSVSKNFMASGSVAAYDVVAKIEMQDAGQRGLNAAKTVYIGKNDVIYYEPIAWSSTPNYRDETVTLDNAASLPDLSRISFDITFGRLTESNSQRTVALNTPQGKLVGLQYTGGTITAWTGWTSRTMNSSGDVGKFTDSFTLVDDYTAGTKISVSMTVDKANNSITVACGDTSNALSYEISDPVSFTGFVTGMYRNAGTDNAHLDIDNIVVTEPDQDYLSIVGDKDFAKAYGTTVTRDYALNQSIVVSGETFSWSVSPAGQGVTVDNGKLSVTGSAPAGTYTLTATSDSRATKTASLEIVVGGFQTISQENATIEGANTYGGIGQTGTYRITKLIDSYGDDVADILPAAVWTSSDASVASITADGALTVTGKGTATLTATITNGTAVSTFTVPIKVDIFFISADAAGNSTAVDTSGLITPAADSAITGYQVTTSKNGKLVKQSVVTTAPTTVDTTGADKFEIAPVFTVKGVTRSASKTISVPADTYNFNITGASGGRFDPYVNDQMLANNMLQGGTAVNKLAINDVVVNEGYATIKLEDAQSNSNIGTLTVVKSPSIVDRVRKVYVLGDSLVCIYYNGGNASNNYQTGWGQVLQSYLTDEYEVVDLGNSGVTAEGLAGTAITQVAVSGKPGDIMLLESGYNDRSYISEERMKDAVRSMYDRATAAGVNAVLVTPNASAHDFKSNVSWSGFMKDVANEKNAKLIDLAALSYNFFISAGYTNDGEPKATYNISDSLHSTYHGAHKMASIVAGGMIDAGLEDAVNTSYTYTFQDSLGKTITCRAAASN